MRWKRLTGSTLGSSIIYLKRGEWWIGLEVGLDWVWAWQVWFLGLDIKKGPIWFKSITRTNFVNWPNLRADYDIFPNLTQGSKLAIV